VQVAVSAFTDLVTQFWEELIARPSGPLAFRFLVQPAMAAIYGVRDGIKDGKSHRVPYLKAILTDYEARRPRLREGIHAVSRIMILGAIMDVAYQLMVFRALRPVETVVVVLGLCFLPYLVVRGPAARLTRLSRRGASIGGRARTLRRG
jgi:hypothetical protein